MVCAPATTSSCKSVFSMAFAVTRVILPDSSSIVIPSVRPEALKDDTAQSVGLSFEVRVSKSWT